MIEECGSYILVEGIIGAGKTSTIERVATECTLLEVLGLNPRDHRLQTRVSHVSPIHHMRYLVTFKEEFDDDDLAKYYSRQDPPLSFIIELQTKFFDDMTINTRMANIIMKDSVNISNGHLTIPRRIDRILQDRSLISNLAFMLLIGTRHLSVDTPREEWMLFKNLLDNIVRAIDQHMCLSGNDVKFLFIHDSIEGCQERVQRRGREYERDLCDEYQEDLLSIYVSLLLEFLSRMPHSSIRVVSVTETVRPFDDSYVTFDDIRSSVPDIPTIIFSDTPFTIDRILSIPWLERDQRDSILEHIRSLTSV